MTQQQLKIWDDYDDYCNDDEVIEWYKGYEKRKARKVQIEKELMPITWHPSHWWVGTSLKTREKRLKNCWSNIFMWPGEGIGWWFPAHKSFKKILKNVLIKMN